LKISCEEWIEGWETPSGGAGLKCMRCGASEVDPRPGKNPSAERVQLAYLRLQGFADLHALCKDKGRA